jgi:serine/threonine protein kinase
MTTPRLLAGRYELGDTLGYGGMSEVHHGLDNRLGRDVAVKVLRADLARDPQVQLRFRREALNAAALNHPAIVAVYDTGEVQSDFGPLPYIVMEYVDGQTLREIATPRAVPRADPPSWSTRPSAYAWKPLTQSRCDRARPPRIVPMTGNMAVRPGNVHSSSPPSS